MALKWKEGELESIIKEIKQARLGRQLVACQGSVVLRNAEQLMYASVADRKQFSKTIKMNNVSDLNRILAMYRYDKKS